MSKSRSLNKVMLIGNLTRNPSIKETNNGVVVCTFGLATNTSWKDKNGEFREKAEYHNLIAFNKLGEICAQVLAVGMLIYAEGEIRNREIVGEDGKKYYRSEIKLNDMFVMDSKGKKGVGIEGAKENMPHNSENSSHEESVEVAPESQNEDSEDDGLNSEDLF